MPVLKALFVILSVILSTSLMSIAHAVTLSEGGATSGGGDEVGIEARRTVRMVSDMIREDHGQLYSEKVKEEILGKSQMAEVMVVDHALPARSGKLEQLGVAFSYSSGKKVTIEIQRQRWNAVDSPAIRDAVIHHELAVLASHEQTGRYDYTDRFLMLRNKFWEKIQSQQLICTFSLFDKNKNGKMIGAAGTIFRDNSSVGGGFEVLADLEKREGQDFTNSVIIRYVASGNGYLRAVFSEAMTSVIENSNFKIFDKVSKTSGQKILFTPYDVAEGMGEARLIPWEHYLVQVGCSKL